MPRVIEVVSRRGFGNFANSHTVVRRCLAAKSQNAQSKALRAPPGASKVARPGYPCPGRPAARAAGRARAPPDGRVALERALNALAHRFDLRAQQRDGLAIVIDTGRLAAADVALRIDQRHHHHIERRLGAARHAKRHLVAPGLGGDVQGHV
jgi:hypothetical protein